MGTSLNSESSTAESDYRVFHDRGVEVFDQRETQSEAQPEVQHPQGSILSGTDIDYYLEDLELSREFVMEAFIQVRMDIESSEKTEMIKTIETYSTAIINAYNMMVDMTLFHVHQWKSKRVESETVSNQYCRIIECAIICSARIIDRLEEFSKIDCT